MFRLLILASLGTTLGCASPPADSPTPPADRPAELACFADDGKKLPTEEQLVQLAKKDPIAFLEACIARYDREVKGYRCTLVKQERIKGVLQKEEIIRVAFQDDPFSVILEWRKNEGKALRALYVKGQNGDKLIVMPAGLAGITGIWERQVDGEEAKEAGRYPLNEFGIKLGMLRTLKPWQEAAKKGTLKVEYLGVKKVWELDNRECYTFKRTYDKPEDDGISDATYFFDKETWLQTGSILKAADGKLIATYFFRDVELNPKFDEGTFSRDAVRSPVK